MLIALSSNEGSGEPGQTRQSLFFPQGINVDEGSDKNVDLKPN